MSAIFRLLLFHLKRYLLSPFNGVLVYNVMRKNLYGSLLLDNSNKFSKNILLIVVVLNSWSKTYFSKRTLYLFVGNRTFVSDQNREAKGNMTTNKGSQNEKSVGRWRLYLCTLNRVNPDRTTQSSYFNNKSNTSNLAITIWMSKINNWISTNLTQ